MTDEIITNQPTESSLDVIQETMDGFLAAADVRAVYGEPIQHDDTTIIPTAEILSALAFGIGSGSGNGVGTDQNPDKPWQGTGGGGGGGGRVLSRPVAIVVASPEGVRVEPVIDITKIALAGLTALGFMVGMMFRMSSRSRSLPDIED